MPVYEYGCSACDHTVEVRHGVHGHGPATCPVCGKPLKLGVLSRVEALADRHAGYMPDDAPGFRSLIPLDGFGVDRLSVGSQAQPGSRARGLALEEG